MGTQPPDKARLHVFCSFHNGSPIEGPQPSRLRAHQLYKLVHIKCQIKSKDEEKKVKTSTTSPKETSNQRQVDDNESASAPVETTTNASTSTRQPVLIDEWGCYVTQKERDQTLRQSDSTEAALNSTRLSSNTVANDDARCKFYTGVNCNVFMSTFNYLVPSLNTEGTQGTPPVPLLDQFFYTLVKLKHKNCTKFQDLSEQACVPKETLIDHFWKWLDHMYVGLEFHKRGICWSHWCPTRCTCVRS